MGFHIGFKDVIDIFLVAILMYQTFQLLKRTGAVNIFIGILTFIIFWLLVSYVFKMELLGGIFDRVVSVGAFALIVLFQDEIRRFFSRSVMLPSMILAMIGMPAGFFLCPWLAARGIVTILVLTGVLWALCFLAYRDFFRRANLVGQ